MGSEGHVAGGSGDSSAGGGGTRRRSRFPSLQEAGLHLLLLPQVFLPIHVGVVHRCAAAGCCCCRPPAGRRRRCVAAAAGCSGGHRLSPAAAGLPRRGKRSARWPVCAGASAGALGVFWLAKPPAHLRRVSTMLSLQPAARSEGAGLLKTLANSRAVRLWRAGLREWAIAGQRGCGSRSQGKSREPLHRRCPLRPPLRLPPATAPSLPRSSPCPACSPASPPCPHRTGRAYMPRTEVSAAQGSDAGGKNSAPRRQAKSQQ